MLKQVIDAFEVIDDPHVDGEHIRAALEQRGTTQVEVTNVNGAKGSTDFVKIHVSGTDGKSHGGPAPTLGIVGRLGGVGARPERIGAVSDADGAIVAIACAFKLVEMQSRGDRLRGDVVISTHICPAAPTEPHEPVPFMGSPVEIEVMNRYEVEPTMDAILSVDTTKGNRVINVRGIAITPTVKEGYILRVSEDLLDIVQWTTGRMPAVCPLSTQDITPYGNEVFHLNSILQPAVATSAPVVGVAVTTETAVPGCGTGANHEVDIELAARFCIEVAKSFGSGNCRFYDPEEFSTLVSLYGPMTRFQTKGGGGSFEVTR